MWWLLALLWFPGVAHAANTLCPPSGIASWTIPLTAPLQFATYELNSIFPGSPSGFLSVQQTNGLINTYVGVPQTVATGLQTSTNQSQYYTTRIVGVYHQFLLFTGSKCPIGYASGGAQWSQ